MPLPPNNNDLQRERVRFLNQSLSLQQIIKQGSFEITGFHSFATIPAIYYFK